MYLLFIDSGSDFPYFMVAAIALLIFMLIISYVIGFRNGKREGERLQLQKQVDQNNKK